MLDFVLGAVVVALAVRGWWRGLLREAIALAVIVVGLLVSFRLSRPGGDVVESMGGVSPEVGRLVAGIVIFLVIGVGAGVASAILHRGIRFVPGLPTLNRAAGAGLSVVATIVFAAIALSLLTVVSPPEVIADQIDESAFAGYLTDPDEVPQRVIGVMSGDRALERLLSLRDLTGSRRVIGGDDVVLLEPTERSRVEIDYEAEPDLLEMINRERAALGRVPLVASAPLAGLARAHAVDAYTSGRFAGEFSDGATLEDRLEAADVLVVSADQVMALAISAEAAQEALLGAEREAGVLTDRTYRRIGIGAVEGPFGVIVVEIVAG